MQQVKLNSFVVVCMLFGILFSLANSVSALRCYQCASGDSWSDCSANSRILDCQESTSQVSVMGRSIFLPAEARQLEPACVSVYAKGTVGGTTGYAYVRDCLFNDKSLCNMIQDVLPSEIRIVDCDLCTTELCNGASSLSVALSSLVMLSIAALLWK
uniref:UPAR/Ly6 domain-containing protein n=1 Tax=Anopheles maculatus TaxID=74869 RepID=A0A182S8S7_9DIPT